MAINFKDNIKKLNKLIKRTDNKGLGIVKMFYGYKIYDLNGDKIKRQLWKEHKGFLKRILISKEDQTFQSMLLRLIKNQIRYCMKNINILFLIYF